ncbi:MAG: hypothetical protein MJ097_01385 [Dorea sp.]|nr:hypothetical protein [Dorea sp.]
MLLTYKECIERYGTDYRIKKEIQAGRLYQKEKGLYSEHKFCSDIEFITTKYPRAIFTAESAYYYYGMTDVIPDSFHLATVRTDSRIKDGSVRQYFINKELFELGKTNMTYHGVQISIYSRERLLVDLIRKKNKLPYDYYKEIISNYRRIAEELDFFVVEECTANLRNRDSIMRTIELEVL